MEPFDTASKSTSHRHKKSLYTESSGEELRRLKSTLTCGGLVTVKEKVSEVDVVHKCFTEAGNSILGAIFCEPLQTKLQDYHRVAWLAD